MRKSVRSPLVVTSMVARRCAQAPCPTSHRNEAPGLARPTRASMPNGHREPFRIGDASPSPVHTSDTEETWAHKKRWHWLARKVLHRFRANAARKKKLRRRVARLTSGKILPRFVSESIAERIAKFLG